jgi:chemotaxis protein CheX
MTTSNPDLVDEVRHLLNRSVSEVFATMFGLEARPMEARDLGAGAEPTVAGSVGFIGDANGVVYIFLRAGFAHQLADRFLGLDASETHSEEMVNDVVGELANMVVGAVKSQLCDGGLACVLTIPTVIRGQNLSAAPVHAVNRQVLGFGCGDEYILVELQLKSGRQPVGKNQNL